MKNLNELYKKLKVLEQKHAGFGVEIQLLKQEIHHYKSSNSETKTDDIPVLKTVIPDTKPKKVKKEKQPNPFNFEKLIGENLINKIGIIITIIGVFIGSKYSIEHELISPTTRIIIGYLVGFIFLGLGFKLKTKYLNYASVLTSGAFTILYFITYIAYSFYSLLPMWLAFLVMCLLTVFTVLTALKLNKQVIAHIGLVGAYAIPFLLSNNSGNISTLFVYIGIINLGILCIAFKKYWKYLFYNAFIITWIFFISWAITDYQSDSQFGIAFLFLNVIFVTFYGISLSYKLIKKEAYLTEDLILILSNSLLFFSVGYYILNSNIDTENYTSIFAIYNAILHGLVALTIYKQPTKDQQLLQLTIGISVLFITLTIPILFNGSWISVFWIGEAVILFWIGRTQQKAFYEKMSYPLITISFYSLLIYWFGHYGNYNILKPETRISLFLNPHFLSSILFTTGIGGINFMNLKKKSTLDYRSSFYSIFSYIIPILLILSTYLAFYLEISDYWTQLYKESKLLSLNQQFHDRSLMKLKIIWLINYSLFFAAILIIINHFKIKKNSLTTTNIVTSSVFTFVFLTLGLFSLSTLREIYLDANYSFLVSTYYIWIRYVSYLFMGVLFYTTYAYLKRATTYKYFDLIAYTILLWMLSSELINLLDLFTPIASHKLGLSILWALYSLYIICLGIWKQKQHLRIAAMVLFGIILVKLFFYDISHLGTIAKTIVFTFLGITLLLISFLYNKYKHLITTKTS